MAFVGGRTYLDRADTPGARPCASVSQEPPELRCTSPKPKSEMRWAQAKAVRPMVEIAFLGARHDVGRPGAPCTRPSRKVIHKPPELRALHLVVPRAAANSQKAKPSQDPN